MNNNGTNKSLEDELRSSQIYKTIVGSGNPTANRVAEGLGIAAQSVDRAINGITSPGAGSPSGFSQNPGSGTRPQAAPSGWQQPAPSQYPASGGSVPPGRAPQTGGPQNRPGQKPAGVNPVPAPQMPQMKMVRRGSPAKYYITAAAAIGYALSGPLYSLGNLLVFALVVAGVFFLSSKLFKGKKEFVPIQEEQPKKKEKEEKPAEKPAEEAKPSRTGNPEVDKIIDEGSGYLKKLRAANDAIPDEALTEDITRMERASADIFRFIADHPKKAPEIRKFMNYYLPTTLKLLNSYQRLSRQSVKGENITSTMFNIAGMMHTVADAFEKQLDSLFTDEAMDISTDISVFETLLKQEGFVGNDVKTKTKEN